MFDDDVWRYLPLGPGPTLALAVVVAAAVIYVTVVRSRATRAIAAAMLAVSVLVVLAVTARGSVANDDGDFSWRLGESIRAELQNVNTSLGLMNVFGNVALFLPIGWLFAVLLTRRRVVVGTVCTLLLSASVEVWQMTSGSFGDIDDIVLNGGGGLLGASAASLLQWLGTRFASSGDRSASNDVAA